MSLSAALSNATSGLNVAARSASVVSSNISNAMTEGHGRREANVAVRSSGGVMVAGVVRHMDAVLVSEWRDAGSELAYSTARTDFFSRLERTLGTPEDGFSIAGRIASLENSLITAASRPDLPERLVAVRDAADSVATTFNTASDTIQSLKMEADARIASGIDRMNELLAQVEKLNGDVMSAQLTGADKASFMDQRQTVIDEISRFVPVTELPREFGKVALVTDGGAILIDGTAAKFDFTGTNVIVPTMTFQNGLLSGLTLNSLELPTDARPGPISGGRLAAYFEIRDELAVEAQAQLDAAARDILTRFQAPGLDPTIGAGDPGLFTDENAAFLPADEIGLAGRISLNTLVKAGTGDVHRLRDGLGATAAGSPGDATLLQGMLSALTERRVPASGSFGTSGITASGLASTLLSRVGSDRALADQTAGFAAARETELKSSLMAEGVDTDAELARLMLIEQAYAANARLIRTVDEMMKTILSI